MASAADSCLGVVGDRAVAAASAAMSAASSEAAAAGSSSFVEGVPRRLSACNEVKE